MQFLVSGRGRALSIARRLITTRKRRFPARNRSPDDDGHFPGSLRGDSAVAVAHCGSKFATGRCDTVAGQALNFAPRGGHEKALKSWHRWRRAHSTGTCDCAERSASDMISLNRRDMFIPASRRVSQEPYVIAIYRCNRRTHTHIHRHLSLCRTSPHLARHRMGREREREREVESEFSSPPLLFVQKCPRV